MASAHAVPTCQPNAGAYPLDMPVDASEITLAACALGCCAWNVARSIASVTSGPRSPTYSEYSFCGAMPPYMVTRGLQLALPRPRPAGTARCQPRVRNTLHTLRGVKPPCRCHKPCRSYERRKQDGTQPHAQRSSKPSMHLVILC